MSPPVDDPVSLAAEFTLSAASETALEFPALLKLLAHLTASDLGWQRVTAIRPFADEDALREHRRLYDEARRLISARPLVPYCEQPFALLLQALAGSGHALEGRDLIAVTTLLQIVGDARARIAEADPPCGALAELAGGVPELHELRKALLKTFDARGEIRENATPLLAELRGRMRSVRQRIYEQLGDLASEHREHLSEETIPLRGGRLVLVLQAGARGRIPGLIHGRSGSGKSFYFEPLEAVESNNQLQQTCEEEEEEKRRILAEMIRRLRDELPALRTAADFVAALDRLQASCRFAEACDGRLVELSPRHQLRLVAARHPLLDPSLRELRGEALGTPGHADPIIPLELELTPERRALVVTGPNAGGKTVVLKTLGLLALAHQCGLPVPAGKESHLPFLGTVVATVGDDQDLLADRSTFSGRLLRLREVWDSAGHNALILLDELGSGTDPDEGAALGTAILESLVERQCLVLITTHLSQVAAAALEAPGAFCAAMLFDTATGNPTFRLLPGPPGGSEALALGRRLGLPRRWLDRAEELLGSEHRDLRRLLAEIERTRQELAATRADLETELADVARLRQRLAEQEAALVDERKSLAKTFKRQLEEFRVATATRLRDELEQLRDELRAGRRKGLAGAAVERLFTDAPVFDDDDESGELKIGGRVKHRRLGWEGTLEKLDRGRAQVATQGKSLSCSAEDLVALTGDAPSPPPSRKRRIPAAPPSRLEDARPEVETAPRELNLIGMRVEPALAALDDFLDRALLASHAAVRVIHGHGSGRLRTAVREHLRQHPAVAAQRPGGADEGGDGATVATLRGS